MTTSHDVSADAHTLDWAMVPSSTEAWLRPRAARCVLGTGVAGAGIGWVVENRDGSIVLARPGDTLVYDGERVTRQ